MLVELLNIPKSDQEWQVWSLHHRLSHDQIRQAAMATRNVSLIDYQVDPITLSDPTSWLQRNAQLHVDMNAAVGSQSSDLQSVDFRNQNQMQAWVWLHWLEHQTVESRLGIGS